MYLLLLPAERAYCTCTYHQKSKIYAVSTVLWHVFRRSSSSNPSRTLIRFFYFIPVLKADPKRPVKLAPACRVAKRITIGFYFVPLGHAVFHCAVNSIQLNWSVWQREVGENWMPDGEGEAEVPVWRVRLRVRSIWQPQATQENHSRGGGRPAAPSQGRPAHSLSIVHHIPLFLLLIISICRVLVSFFLVISSLIDRLIRQIWYELFGNYRLGKI